METNEKTLLERVIEQKTLQITRAIEEAILDGAKVERCTAGAYVDNVLLIREGNYDAAIVLNLKSDLIKGAVSEDIDVLERKRKALQNELTEIENKIERTKRDETDND